MGGPHFLHLSQYNGDMATGNISLAKLRRIPFHLSQYNGDAHPLRGTNSHGPFKKKEASNLLGNGRSPYLPFEKGGIGGISIRTSIENDSFHWVQGGVKLRGGFPRGGTGNLLPVLRSNKRKTENLPAFSHRQQVAGVTPVHAAVDLAGMARQP